MKCLDCITHGIVVAFIVGTVIRLDIKEMIDYGRSKGDVISLYIISVFHFILIKVEKYGSVEFEFKGRGVESHKTS